MTDVVAGIDIGGTKTALVLATLSGEIVRRSVAPTRPIPGLLEVTDDVVTCHGLAKQIEHMLSDALQSSPSLRLRSIGIVSAGPIRSGMLWNPTNIVPADIPASHHELPCRMPLVEPLVSVFECPTDLLNDCSAAVLGEVTFGMGKDVADKTLLHLAYATISTGFGVGAWIDGGLVLGKDGNAGELGHILVRRDGLPCGCGNRGCAEAYCSGTGIVTNARARLQNLSDVAQGSPELYRMALADHASSSTTPLGWSEVASSITPTRVFDAATANDPLAVAVIQDAVFAGAIAFSAIANAYDPEFITVGGGIALAHPEIIKPIAQEMEQHLNVCAPKVCLTSLGSEIASYGAIAMGLQLLEE